MRRRDIRQQRRQHEEVERWTLAGQVADAQAAVASWPEEKRRNVQLQGTVPRYTDERPERRGGGAMSDRAGEWVSARDRMPSSGVTVLACYRNALGNWRRIRACWVAAKSVESGTESEIGEYDEASDTYYDPEGWYEEIDNLPEYTAIVVHQGEITHWQPLPPPPSDD